MGSDRTQTADETVLVTGLTFDEAELIAQRRATLTGDTHYVFGGETGAVVASWRAARLFGLTGEVFTAYDENRD